MILLTASVCLLGGVGCFMVWSIADALSDIAHAIRAVAEALEDDE